MNTAKLIGMSSGLIVGLLLAICLLRFFNKDHATKTKYDERQNFLRLKAFKIGFWVTMCAGTLFMFLNSLEIDLPLDMGMQCFTIVIIGILALASASLWNNSYWGLNTNKTRFWICMIVAMLINIMVPIIRIIDGTFLTNGKLCIMPGTNLYCALIIMVIGIEYIIKTIVDKKAGDDIEES